MVESDREIRARSFGLELAAMSDVWSAGDPPSESEIETSKAISAKRQADALRRLADLAELVAAQRFNLGPQAIPRRGL